jgi:hypothetical protein
MLFRRAAPDMRRQGPRLSGRQRSPSPQVDGQGQQNGSLRLPAHVRERLLPNPGGQASRPVRMCVSQKSKYNEEAPTCMMSAFAFQEDDQRRPERRDCARQYLPRRVCEGQIQKKRIIHLR